MKRPLNRESHILQDSDLPHTWYLVVATCNQAEPTVCLERILVEQPQHYRGSSTAEYCMTTIAMSMTYQVICSVPDEGGYR